MIGRRRGFGLRGTRGRLGIFGSALLLGAVAVAVLAPAGQAATPASIAYSPALYSYGRTAVGTTASKTFTLRNSGGSSTGALSIAILGSSTLTITTDRCAGVNLAANGTCTVTVSYTPTKSGHTDVTTLWAYGNKPVVVAAALLSGTGTAAAAPSADLAITDTDGASGIVAGTATTYTITVTNSGPSAVAGAKVADTMPSAIGSDSFTAVGSGGATGFTSGSGNIADTVSMPAGATITYTVTANVESSATGSLSNTATVTARSGVTDPNSGNNSATDTEQITRSADLTITKTDGDGGSSITGAQGNVVAGTSVTYTITVTNSGPSDVAGASVVDDVPAGISSDSFTSVTSGGASDAAGSGDGNIDDSVTLPHGSSITYTVDATVSSTATGSLSNTATLIAPHGVTNSGNNSATDTDQITRSADLTITKTDGATSVPPGGELTYTIVVSNDGPSNVTGARVVDDMPAGISNDSFTSATSGGASDTAGSGNGNIDDSVNLPNGSSITYTVDATVSSTATPTLSLSNTATVTAPEGMTDSNPNNSATATNTIGATESCTSNCTVSSGNPDTGTVNVRATGPTGTTGTVQAAVFTGPLACTYAGPELDIDPNTYEVVASSSAFTKTIAIEFPAPSDAPPINPSLFYIPFEAYVLGNTQICFQATYPFTVKGGGGATENPSTGLYTGLLPDCPVLLSRATGPCDERLASSITNIGANGTTNYDVNETAFVPAGEPGDPRMN